MSKAAGIAKGRNPQIEPAKKETGKNGIFLIILSIILMQYNIFISYYNRKLQNAAKNGKNVNSHCKCNCGVRSGI